jgi:hypothetical protein
MLFDPDLFKYRFQVRRSPFMHILERNFRALRVKYRGYESFTALSNIPLQKLCREQLSEFGYFGGVLWMHVCRGFLTTVRIQWHVHSSSMRLKYLWCVVVS